MKDFFSKWTQKILVTGLMKILFKIFFKFEVVNPEKIKNLSGPLLIIGNHKFSLDTFAMGGAMSLRSKLHPIKIMGENNFFNNPFVNLLFKIGFIKLVYKTFGVFPAIRGKGLDIALKEPENIIKNNGVVLLHPEGRVCREKEICPFKRGASYLALKTNVRILPVVFKMKENGFCKRYQIKFGNIFHLPNDLTPEEGAEYMKKIIENLYKTLR